MKRDRDKNRGEREEVRRWIGSPHFQSFDFQGGHGWAPQEVFERAMDWVEDKVRRPVIGTSPLLGGARGVEREVSSAPDGTDHEA
jgi:hypothetical protein